MIRGWFLGDLWMFGTWFVDDLWMMVHKVYTQNVWRRCWLSESRVLHRVTASCCPRICETIEVAKCFSTVPMCESSLLSGVLRSLQCHSKLPSSNIRNDRSRRMFFNGSIVWSLSVAMFSNYLLCVLSRFVSVCSILYLICTQFVFQPSNFETSIFILQNSNPQISKLHCFAGRFARTQKTETA